jgi:hypothetical protein
LTLTRLGRRGSHSAWTVWDVRASAGVSLRPALEAAVDGQGMLLQGLIVVIVQREKVNGVLDGIVKLRLKLIPPDGCRDAQLDNQPLKLLN